MRRSIFFLILSTIISTQIYAEEVRYLKAGSYICNLIAESKYFNSENPYRLNLTQSGETTESQSIELIQADKKNLIADRNPDAYFIFKKGNIYSKKRYGYAMLTPESDDFKTLRLTVATREGVGTYMNAHFSCVAQGEPEVVVSLIYQFKCTTDKPFYNGKIHRLKFGLAHLEDPGEISVFSLNDDEEYPIQVTPKKSPLVSLNENLAVSLGEEKIVLHGDSDGFFLVRLALFKDQNYQKGFVEIEDLGEGIGNHRAEVTCTVK